MSVRSENFNDIIAYIVADDKQGVISFLRSQGVSVSSGADSQDVVEALYVGFKNSNFSKSFSSWADNKYSSNANAGGGSMPSAGSGFDPMDTQSGGFSPMETQYANAGHMPVSNGGGEFDPMSTQGGGEFDPMSTQSGTNLMDDNFANAGGQFDPMSTQGGGEFDPMSTQSGTNLMDDNFANVKGYTPFDPKAEVGTTGSKFGNFLRGLGGIGGILDKGTDIYNSETDYKNQRDLNKAKQKTAELNLETLLAQNQLSQTQYEQQLAILRETNKAPQGNVILYVIGGVVLLAGIGTAIYFATRKK